MDEKSPRMPSMRESRLRPSWRRSDTSNDKKSLIGCSPEKKMLIYDDRSRYVYENKQNYDKMPGEMSDIFGKVTRFLQKIADFEGQFALILRFRKVLEGIILRVADTPQWARNPSPVSRPACPPTG